MNQFSLATGCAIALLSSALNFTPVFAKESPKTAVFEPALAYSYADVADMVLAAQFIVHVRVKSAKKISGKASVSAIPGRKRMLVAGDVVTLIRGEGGIPPRITWLVDLAPDASGRFPKLPKADLILLGRSVPGQPTEVQLIAPDAQLFLNSQAGQRVRTIITDAVGPTAPPVVTGITDAFYTPGPVEGEGQSQIFLSTASERPISIGVERRPGMVPVWSLYLTETTSDGVAPPRRDSLLWYRLACVLPATLPAEAVVGQDSDSARHAAEDYRFVRDQIGVCTRNRPAIRGR
jgi:hypothetical protein